MPITSFLVGRPADRPTPRAQFCVSVVIYDNDVDDYNFSAYRRPKTKTFPLCWAGLSECECKCGVQIESDWRTRARCRINHAHTDCLPTRHYVCSGGHWHTAQHRRAYRHRAAAAVAARCRPSQPELRLQSTWTSLFSVRAKSKPDWNIQRE